MSKVTIKFWDSVEEKFIDNIDGNRLAVAPSGSVIMYSFDEPEVYQVAFWVVPHFYQDGERIA